MPTPAEILSDLAIRNLETAVLILNNENLIMHLLGHWTLRDSYIYHENEKILGSILQHYPDSTVIQELCKQHLQESVIPAPVSVEGVEYADKLRASLQCYLFGFVRQLFHTIDHF